MEEDPKLKAALELKKKIEKDLGLESEKASQPKETLSVRASSYNLDFNSLTTFSDLYDFSDFDIGDEKIASMMESSNFDKKEFSMFLRKRYDDLIATLKKKKDDISMYNLFITYMAKGSLKEALKTSIELKNTYPLSPLGYLALSHVLFFLEDERWQESFKIYLSMDKDDRLAAFVWKVFKEDEGVKFPKMSSRKYMLDIAMLSLGERFLPRDVLAERICARAFNPCSHAFCKLLNLESGIEVEKEPKNSYCYLENYAKSLFLYKKGEYSKALLALPKLRDPKFLYLEGLCHYALDEKDAFNAIVKEIVKMDPKASFFISISQEEVKSFGLAEEGSAVLYVSPSKLGNDYQNALRKLMFEVANMRGYSPSHVNFGMKMRNYQIMRVFFGFKSCKGVNEGDKR